MWCIRDTKMIGIRLLVEQWSVFFFAAIDRGWGLEHVMEMSFFDRVTNGEKIVSPVDWKPDCAYDG